MRHATMASVEQVDATPTRSFSSNILAPSTLTFLLAALWRRCTWIKVALFNAHLYSGSDANVFPHFPLVPEGNSRPLTRPSLMSFPHLRARNGIQSAARRRRRCTRNDRAASAREPVGPRPVVRRRRVVGPLFSPIEDNGSSNAARNASQVITTASR